MHQSGGWFREGGGGGGSSGGAGCQAGKDRGRNRVGKSDTKSDEM